MSPSQGEEDFLLGHMLVGFAEEYLFALCILAIATAILGLISALALWCMKLRRRNETDEQAQLQHRGRPLTLSPSTGLRYLAASTSTDTSSSSPTLSLQLVPNFKSESQWRKAAIRPQKDTLKIDNDKGLEVNLECEGPTTATTTSATSSTPTSPTHHGNSGAEKPVLGRARRRTQSKRYTFGLNWPLAPTCASSAPSSPRHKVPTQSKAEGILPFTPPAGKTDNHGKNQSDPGSIVVDDKFVQLRSGDETDRQPTPPQISHHDAANVAHLSRMGPHAQPAGHNDASSASPLSSSSSASAYSSATSSSSASCVTVPILLQAPLPNVTSSHSSVSSASTSSDTPSSSSPSRPITQAQRRQSMPEMLSTKSKEGVLDILTKPRQTSVQPSTIHPAEPTPRRKKYIPTSSQIKVNKHVKTPHPYPPHKGKLEDGKQYAYPFGAIKSPKEIRALKNIHNEAEKALRSPKELLPANELSHDHAILVNRVILYPHNPFDQEKVTSHTASKGKAALDLEQDRATRSNTTGHKAAPSATVGQPDSPLNQATPMEVVSALPHGCHVDALSPASSPAASLTSVTSPPPTEIHMSPPFPLVTSSSNHTDSRNLPHLPQPQVFDDDSRPSSFTPMLLPLPGADASALTSGAPAVIPPVCTRVLTRKVILASKLRVFHPLSNEKVNTNHQWRGGKPRWCEVECIGRSGKPDDEHKTDDGNRHGNQTSDDVGSYEGAESLELIMYATQREADRKRRGTRGDVGPMLSSMMAKQTPLHGHSEQGTVITLNKGEHRIVSLSSVVIAAKKESERRYKSVSWSTSRPSLISPSKTGRLGNVHNVTSGRVDRTNRLSPKSPMGKGTTNKTSPRHQGEVIGGLRGELVRLLGPSYSHIPRDGGNVPKDDHHLFDHVGAYKESSKWGAVMRRVSGGDTEGTATLATSKRREVKDGSLALAWSQASSFNALGQKGETTGLLKASPIAKNMSWVVGALGVKVGTKTGQAFIERSFAVVTKGDNLEGDNVWVFEAETRNQRDAWMNTLHAVTQATSTRSTTNSTSSDCLEREDNAHSHASTPTLCQHPAKVGEYGDARGKEDLFAAADAVRRQGNTRKDDGRVCPPNTPVIALVSPHADISPWEIADLPGIVTQKSDILYSSSFSSSSFSSPSASSSLTGAHGMPSEWKVAREYGQQRMHVLLAVAGHYVQEEGKHMNVSNVDHEDESEEGASGGSRSDEQDELEREEGGDDAHYVYRSEGAGINSTRATSSAQDQSPASSTIVTHGVDAQTPADGEGEIGQGKGGDNECVHERKGERQDRQAYGSPSTLKKGSRDPHRAIRLSGSPCAYTVIDIAPTPAATLPSLLSASSSATLVSPSHSTKRSPFRTAIKSPLRSPMKVKSPVNRSRTRRDENGGRA